MKAPLGLILIICLGLNPLAGIAQCSNLIQQVSYDTTVTGVGSTNSPYVFTFPMFDGAEGTLLEVNISSVLTLSYHYDIENTLASARNHQLRLSRYDDISSSVLLAPISSYLQVPQHPLWYNNNLAASNGVPGSGPDFRSVAPFYVLDHETIVDETLSNTADFMGAGTVSFDYGAGMYLTKNPVSGAVLTNDGAEDEITFRITYVYCSNILLASDITSFTAREKENGVHLRWTSVNRNKGVRYEVLKSTDGKTFTAVKQFTGSDFGNPSPGFQYDYTPQSNENGKLLFRIKMIEENGSVKHSALRVVDLSGEEKKARIRLLPNPSNGGDITVVLHNTVRSDWDVELFTMGGQLMGRQQFNNTLIARLRNNTRLSRGIYIVRATNKKTMERFVERLVVN